MFRVFCKLGFYVALTSERYFHIITRHPEILEQENRLKEAILDPDFVRRSKHDPQVLLFYKAGGKEYIVAVVKQDPENGFVLTAYITDFIKEGDLIWKK